MNDEPKVRRGKRERKGRGTLSRQHHVLRQRDGTMCCQTMMTAPHVATLQTPPYVATLKMSQRERGAETERGRDRKEGGERERMRVSRQKERGLARQGDIEKTYCKRH